jgi:hypothetical protein
MFIDNNEYSLRPRQEKIIPQHSSIPAINFLEMKESENNHNIAVIFFLVTRMSAPYILPDSINKYLIMIMHL